ncbi:MAG: MFS transporter [Planctomycetes bacterium]|nr:MFS transporter [Planctomycetota bacterium]
MTNSGPTGANDCPLNWPDQRRNLILFACCTGMQYLAAPVLYVGITQASLCRLLRADTRTSNLPATLFFAMTAMPALIAWVSPRVSALQRNMTICYGVSALMLAATALVLTLPVPNALKLAMVILQGGVSGAAMPAAIALLWEVIGRGSAESRRGLALSLAFGVGPILAVLGSLAQTALLGGDLFGLHFDGVDYPHGFVALFGFGAPIMALAAGLSQFFVVPPVPCEPEREPWSSVVGLLVGLPLMFAAVAFMQVAAATEEDAFRYLGYLSAVGATVGLVWHFRAILQQQVLLCATLVTILVYAGNMIPSNMNLYSREVLGIAADLNAGPQNLLRFGLKALAGLILGWLLTRTNPRMGILATSGILLASVLWAMLVTGPWYLYAIAIFGAGELVGVYAPNYIVSSSRPDELRRNMAFVTMLMAPAAPAGYLYGALVDLAKSNEWTAFGLTSEALGFRLSFFVCALFIAAGIAVAWVWLPSRPRPRDISPES